MSRILGIQRLEALPASEGSWKAELGFKLRSNCVKFPLHCVVSLDSFQECDYIILYSDAGGDGWLRKIYIRCQDKRAAPLHAGHLEMTFQPLLVFSSIMSLCLWTFRTYPLGFGPVWKTLTLQLQVSFSLGWFFYWFDYEREPYPKAIDLLLLPPWHPAHLCILQSKGNESPLAAVVWGAQIWVQVRWWLILGKIQ